MFDTPNEVAVTIGGKRFYFWSKIRVTKSLDKMDVVDLLAAFDPDNVDFRKAFVPFSFQPLEVTVNDKPFFTGTMPLAVPSLAADRSEVTVGAYSLPGVLGECTPAADALPLEWKKQDVQAIAKILVDPFDIGIDAVAEPGQPFDKIAMKPGQKILPFLTALAKQRNQVLASNVTGDLVFWTGDGGVNPAVPIVVPKAMLKQGEQPLASVEPAFNTSQYYSEITGLKPMRVRSKKSIQFTVRNTLLPDVYRPYVFEVDDVKDADIEGAVTAKIGRMWGNTVGYRVTVATWRDMIGDLWVPNTFVSLEAPGAMIYKPYNFLIKSVVFRKDDKKESAELSLVLPGAYTGEDPGSLPWDE